MAEKIYKVADPDGNEREIAGPEGATDEQIISEAKRLFSGTEGGAATGVQRQPRLSSAGTAGATIAGATGMGAFMGAVAPEILSGAAQAVRPFPMLSGMAPALEVSSRVARGVGRPVAAAMGGMSGFASETAGQAAEGAGWGTAASEATRFIAGGVVPTASVAPAKLALEIYAKKLPTSVEASGLKLVAIKIANKLSNRQNIDEEEAAFLNKLVGEVRGGAPSEAPARGVYDILQTGAKQRLAMGDTEATTLLDNASRHVQRELDAATKGPVAYATKAQERIAKRGEEALAVAQLQRLNLGEDVPHSDIGNSLRSVIVGKNQAAIETRRAEYKVAEEARDAIVQSKEASGNYVTRTPEYGALVTSLQNEAVPGRRSPDVQKSFKNILSQIQNQEKDVFGQPKPISFQVLDDVRRQLGEVFRGNPPEGYAAIDAATARKYYAQITEIQKKYAGDAQSKLLDQYSDASEGLQMFGSKAGKRVTAVDRYDDTRFQTNAEALPRQFFGTKQGVQDLVELTGNRAAVVKAAKDFATSELNGLTALQTQQWMTKRREMLTELPEVRDAVVKYANHLQYGETTARSAENAVGKLKTYGTQQQAGAQQRGADIQRQAVTRAGDITSQRGQEAVSLLGPRGEMFPVQNVNALIDKGSTDAWATAAPHILASPGGKEMLADSIRQRLADRATTSTKGLSDFFNDNARPGLTATRLMPPQQMDQIAGQLKAIENMKLPEPEKIGLARRLLLQAFAGYASSGGARAATGLAALIPGASQQQQPSGLESLIRR